MQLSSGSPEVSHHFIFHLFIHVIKDIENGLPLCHRHRIGPLCSWEFMIKVTCFVWIPIHTLSTDSWIFSVWVIICGGLVHEGSLKLGVDEIWETRVVLHSMESFEFIRSKESTLHYVSIVIHKSLPKRSLVKVVSILIILIHIILWVLEKRFN